MDKLVKSIALEAIIVGAGSSPVMGTTGLMDKLVKSTISKVVIAGRGSNPLKTTI